MNTILIVDDDRLVVAALQVRLDRAGYQTIVAHDGHAALNQFRRHRPNVVLLDASMPNMSGFEVCDQIRAEDPERQTTIFIVSGASSPSADFVADCASMSDCDGYIRKPYDSEELLELIGQHVGSTSPSEALLCL